MDNFKEIEPDDICPPHIQVELVSEIDTIRNSLRVVQVFAGDFFGVMASLFMSDTESYTNQKDA